MSPAQLPADWRERLLRALAAEGVTEPPYVPIWRLVLIDILKLSGWLLLFFLGFIALFFLAFWVFDGDPPWGMILLFFLIFPVVIWIVTPRATKILRQLETDFAGRNPSYAVANARRAPIFYLRSFAFDRTASEVPKFYQHTFAFFGAGGAYPTPETALIFRMRRYAPVLAIGRPGELDPPPGAMRFHVTDACWEPTVKSIAPCCEIVIWVSGDTPGLSWEIQHLVAQLPPQRLLLWPHVYLYKGTPQQRAVEWQRFVDSHSKIFPKPLPRDVESIRFIAFDADWTPIPIPSTRFPVTKKDWRADRSASTFGLGAFLDERFH
jgi:hypothetical protein